MKKKVKIYGKIHYNFYFYHKIYLVHSSVSMLERWERNLLKNN
jgi:hypothetical protein